LKEIKYDKNLRIWKYGQFILSFLAIISYFMQYFIDSYYALTFTLEILKIKSVQNIIIMLYESMKSLFYILLLSQSIILTFTFLVFGKNYDNDNSISLIETYFKLGK
jgi:hypothetical protein